jgi:hypothetical protein
MSDEIEPFLLYRFQEGQFACALWQLEQGEQAVALFLSGESARAYREAAGLAGWSVLRPPRQGLQEVLTACQRAGVRYAVLDPDLRAAKKIFDLDAVLRAAEPAAGGGP